MYEDVECAILEVLDEGHEMTQMVEVSLEEGVIETQIDLNDEQIMKRRMMELQLKWLRKMEMLWKQLMDLVVSYLLKGETLVMLMTQLAIETDC